MKVFTKEEATTVVRPEFGAWTWPEPVNVMISNCGPVIRPVVGFLARTTTGDPFEFAVARNMLETLYRHGYAVAKLDAEAIEAGDLTRTELLAELTAERARYEALRTSVRQCAERMGMSGVKFDLLELTQPQEARHAE